MPEPDWTRVSRNNGYVIVYCPAHPHAWTNGYVYAHRAIMERHLGRILRKDEHIHHRNEVRTDNDIENLELVSNPNHGRHHRLQHPARTIELICPAPRCGRKFIRAIRKTRGKKRSFCSRRCIGAYTAAYRSWRPKRISENTKRIKGLSA